MFKSKSCVTWPRQAIFFMWWLVSISCVVPCIDPLGSFTLTLLLDYRVYLLTRLFYGSSHLFNIFWNKNSSWNCVLLCFFYYFLSKFFFPRTLPQEGMIHYIIVYYDISMLWTYPKVLELTFAWCNHLVILFSFSLTHCASEISL